MTKEKSAASVSKGDNGVVAVMVCLMQTKVLLQSGRPCLRCAWYVAGRCVRGRGSSC
jgi:hypothetical protein